MAWCSLVGVLLTGAATFGQTTFHVAPGGDDAGAGTSEKPFATVARARDAVRQLRKASPRPQDAVTVYLHGGEYPFTSATTFDAQDSGTPEAPVVYEAFERDTVVFRGGVLLKAEHWQAVTDAAVLERLPQQARGKVMQLDLKAYGLTPLDPLPVTGMAAGSLHAHKIVPVRPAYYELFWNDRALPPARWPNSGYVTTGKIIASGAAPRFWSDDIPKEKRDAKNVPVFQYRDDRHTRWARAAEPWIFLWNNFYADIALPIRAIDPRARTVTLEHPTGYGMNQSGYDASDKKYYVYNLLEEIDQAGEWHIDRAAGVLYCWPPQGLAVARVLLSRTTEPAFVLDGASHLTLRGITVEGARCEEAIRITGGRGNLIDGCTLKNLAGRAVTVDGGAAHAVRNCHIFNTGAGGIYMSGGDRKTLTPAAHAAENNHIHDFSRVKKSYSAAVDLDGVGNAARHNRIHGGEHYAIRFGGNDMLIEYNEIFDVVRTATDMGAIYTGRDVTALGNVIRYNYFHDIGNNNPGHGSQAIFIDDGSSGMLIAGNVFFKAGSNAAIKYHGGTRNVARDNIFVGPPPSAAVNHLTWGDSFPGRLKSGTLRQRLDAVDYRGGPWKQRWPWLATVLEDKPPRGSNVTAGNVIVSMTVASGAGWWSKEAGNFVTKSDPGFVDFENHNFAMKKESEVFKKLPGFEPPPFSKMGLVNAAAGLAAASPGCFAQSAPTTRMSGTAAAQHAQLGIEPQRRGGDPTTHPGAQWFPSAGLGLFVHWGISSVHGSIDLSWAMMANKPFGGGTITPRKYFALADQFAPEHYDPDLWLSAAAKAGFRYAVLTTRHHDGYSMWPSTVSDFGTRTHMGGRDLVKPFVDACRRHGLKVGLYYSPPDWHWNRRYMSFNYGSADQKRFPGRQNFGLDHELVTLEPKPTGWDERYRQYVREQVLDLLKRYSPDLLWFDGGPAAIDISEIRRCNPAIVVNPRMHGRGDFQTFELRMPSTRPEGWWELCEIWPNCGWGYERGGGESYRSLSWMLGRLRQVRRWGGNYLINVGPRPDGTLPPAYYQRMSELAEAGGFKKLDEQWLKEHQ
ncbi:MAG: alpha-L-fucosidase [Planctomycetaceae bacterium]|nr:alpha-L-fucosidase [Planctomycetaceae bacterium]